MNKETFKIRAWARLNVPMIAYAWPRVVESSTETVVIELPLRRRTKNHWGTMYFGALAVGADLAVGLLAMNGIEKYREETGEKMSLVFKDFQAEFQRRPDGPVQFRCQDGEAIQAAILEARQQRTTIPCQVLAFVGDQQVAQMQLGLSLKRR